MTDKNSSSLKRRVYKMSAGNGRKKRYIEAFCYLISLVPLFLPWCYFDKEIDGIKNGIDIIGYAIPVALGSVTILGILFAKGQVGKMITSIVLMLHVVVILFMGLTWYVPLLTDFSLQLSLDAAHYGFYLSLLCSTAMCLFYVKNARDNR